MTGFFRHLRSPRVRLQFRSLLTRPVIYGAVVQAVALNVYYWSSMQMTKDVFLVGLIGPVVAAILAAHDSEVVAAPTAGVLGLVPFFGAYLAYGAWTASAFEYVTATWMFAGYVAMTATWSLLLFGGFALFGIIAGWLIWLLKGYLATHWGVETFGK